MMTPSIADSKNTIKNVVSGELAENIIGLAKTKSIAGVDSSEVKIANDITSGSATRALHRLYLLGCLTRQRIEKSR